jgi:hypothetical protein
MRVLPLVKRTVVTGVFMLTGASLVALAAGPVKSEHWGVVTRNTIGSPVAELRDGPFVPVPGPAGAPPYGKGSLGLSVAAPAGAVEKVDFGNEVDFFGDSVLDLQQVGFHVFQTGENALISPGNMPNIRFEIDPNLNLLPTSNYSTLVWLPDPAPVVNQWSGYLDATSSGEWYLTGGAGTTSGCHQGNLCTFADLMLALNDGGDPPTILSVAVGKGRDNRWTGAIDGFRINDTIFDFEPEPKGVHGRKVKK